MKIVSFETISIQNFLSYGKRQTIKFKDGITAILSMNHDKNNDTNGGGKSALFNAIAFALFGNTIKDLKKDEIVNRIAGEDCLVELEFTVDDNGKKDKYCISRGIAPSFCKLYKNDEDITLSGIPATNDYIANLIGTSENMFQNTVMMSADDQVPFMRQRKNEKREFIEGVFSLEFIKDMAKIVKSEADDISKKLFTKTGEHLGWEKNIENIKLNIETFTNSKEQAVKNHESHIKEIEKQIAFLEGQTPEFPSDDVRKDILRRVADNKERSDKAESERDSFKKRYAEVKAAISSTETMRKNHEKENIENQKKIDEIEAVCQKRFGVGADYVLKLEQDNTYGFNIDGFEKSTKDKQERKYELQHKMALAIDKYRRLESLGEKVCPTCGRPYDGNDITARNEEINDLKKAEELCRGEIESLSIDIKRNDDAVRSLKSKQREAKSLSLEITAIKSRKIHDLSEYDEKLKELNDELSKLKDRIPVLAAEKDALAKEAEDLSDEMNNFLTIKANYEIHEKNLKFYKKGLEEAKEDARRTAERADESIQSLKNQLSKAEENIRNLEKETDDLERQTRVYGLVKEVLSDSGFRAFMIKRYVNILNKCINKYLDELGSPIIIKFDEYFDDTMIDTLTGKECSYASLSGGEKRRLDLATVLGLVDMREMQGVVKFDHLFFDEIFDSALSSGACGKLMSMLVDREKKMGESSMLITHKQEMQNDDNVSHVLTVEKIGGVSSISYTKD